AGLLFGEGPEAVATIFDLRRRANVARGVPMQLRQRHAMIGDAARRFAIDQHFRVLDLARAPRKNPVVAGAIRLAGWRIKHPLDAVAKSHRWGGIGEVPRFE